MVADVDPEDPAVDFAIESQIPTFRAFLLEDGYLHCFYDGFAVGSVPDPVVGVADVAGTGASPVDVVDYCYNHRGTAAAPVDTVVVDILVHCHDTGLAIAVVVGTDIAVAAAAARAAVDLTEEVAAEVGPYHFHHQHGLDFELENVFWE